MALELICHRCITTDTKNPICSPRAKTSSHEKCTIINCKLCVINRLHKSGWFHYNWKLHYRSHEPLLALIITFLTNWILKSNEHGSSMKLAFIANFGIFWAQTLLRSVLNIIRDVLDYWGLFLRRNISDAGDLSKISIYSLFDLSAV